MRAVLRYLKSYKKEIVLSPLFKLLEAFFELIVPLVVASIIDVGIKNSDSSHVLKCCLIMILLGLVGLVCAISAQFFAARAAVGFAAKVRSALFGHIQRFSYTQLDTLGTSSLITNMTSDINQLQTGVNLVLRLFLRSPVIVFGAMIMAFTIDLRASVPFVVLIPALSAVVFGIMLACIPLYKKVQQRLDKLLGITRENLNGTRVVRAFNLQDSQISDFKQANSELNGIQKFVGGISALMNPLTFVLVNIAVIFLIKGGALKVYDGDITQGELIALYNYMSQILIELIKLANLIITVTKAVACGNRIGAVLEIPASEHSSATQNDTDSSDSSIEFKNVSLRYENAAEDSLTDITFSVKSGQTLGIIGSTGSGKSSLVNMIPRFYPATSGEIIIEGKDINEYSSEALRDIVGVVPQKSVLFKGTVRSNLLWGNKDADENAVLEALDTAQAKDFVMEKSGGIDTPVEQGGKNFSGGQRQRLAIARAIIKHPKILILDDSSSALDYATDASLRKAIKELPYPHTTVIVSQRTSSIMYADLIVVLDDGRIVGCGTHDELLEACLTYKEIYDSQFSHSSVSEQKKGETI